MTMRMGKSLVQEETRRAVLMLFGERGRGKPGKCGRRWVARRRMVRWWRRVLRVLRVRKKRYWVMRGRAVMLIVWRVGGVVELEVVRGWMEEEEEVEEEWEVGVEVGSGGLAFSTRAQVR